jgi:hypothetical protein
VLLPNLLFQQGLSSINLPLFVSSGKKNPNQLIAFWITTRSGKTWVSWYKIPRPCTLKLAWTTICLDNVIIHIAPNTMYRIPLQHECMLDIQCVMTYVIKTEVVDFFDDTRLYISGVRYRVVLIGNVN